MGKRKSIRRYRRRWLFGVTIVVAIVAAAIGVLVLVRQDELDRYPWAFVAIGFALLAALGGMMLTAAEGKLESDLGDDDESS